ncbi:SWAP/Surp, Zinc finger, CCCH-type [Artemisia annua]|uniref:SWAP/Surp, Zinc finger, CCCH-type n=1 Tax=Artemisia annua TaxID=35608 RepID=A0A2U1MC99_ARTAN|nr:SWAP/Surp, Zinc finger, CCCH-type [Artemisia annua]
MYNNQGNYQQYGQRLPPPPPQFQKQTGRPPYGPPNSAPPNGMMNSNQSYSIPRPPPQNPNWSQTQHVSPSIQQIPPPPHPQGQQFYRVPPPQLPPPPSSSYFTHGQFGHLPPPPPPPPSSPPPGPPPLPASTPPPNVNSQVKGSETSVKMSDMPPPPPRPRDEKTVRKIEVLCNYIVKNGDEFEQMMCQKELGNPEFEFLFGGPPGSEAAISHEYFKWMKRKCRSSESFEGADNRDTSLKPLGISSLMQPDGTLHAAGNSHSPAGSDMDMEDDITQPEEPGIGKPSESAKHEPALVSYQVDMTAEEKALCSEPAGVIEQGANLSQDDTQYEKSSKKVGVADSERSTTDSKIEKINISLHQEMNQSNSSAVAKDNPFKLIQGYASDDGSESDNDPHFENLSPEAVSRQVKAESDNELHFENMSPAVSRQVIAETDNDLHFENISPQPGSPLFKENDIETKNSSELNTGRGPLSGPVTEASLDISSKILEPSTNTENLENRTDGGTSVKQTERREGDDTAGHKNDGSKKQDSNVKLEVDEFGRAVKKDSSDSGSDHYSRRRSRRDRSRSRSRSPHGRRRRRRREKRSRSRSWSPKKRSRSRSPYRRNRSQLQEVCLDHRRGLCFRTACRYIHETDKTEESRWHKNKQQYHEVSDKFENSDKLYPEKSEDGIQEVTKKEIFEPPSETAEVASGHEIKTFDVPSNSASAGIYPQYQAPPSFVHPRLAPLPLPPPPRGGPLPQYQQNQLPLSTNYPFQNFVRPFPMNYQIPQQPVGSYEQPGLVSSNPIFSQDPPPPPPAGMIQSFSGENVPRTSEFASRTSSHYNPYASTFDQPMNTHFSSGVINQDTVTSLSNQYGSSVGQNHVPDVGQMRQFPQGNQYDPLFDSIDPSSNRVVEVEENSKHKAVAVSEENDEFGETADAEVGAVENDSPSPSSPMDLPDMATGEIEIDQVKNSGKTKKSKDSRSMKLFKVSVADFVKEVLKPSWKQGNMSKEAFKTIVKKTVDKVSGAMKSHQIPKSQAKINHYIDSSQRKLTKLVMGYVDKYVKA